MFCPMAGIRQTRPPVFVAKTVVTTNLLVDLAEHYGVEVKETLTGFKFIAGHPKAEGTLQYVVGGEELRLPRG